MLCGFHIWVKNPPIKAILKHPKLYELFNMDVGANTAEIKGNKYEAKYKDLIFTIIDEKYISISGSMHKYYQDGTNYNDFSFENMVNAINEFCSTFHINPNNAILRSFEFGVNLSIDAKKIINAALIHQTTLPTIDLYRGKGLSKEFEHQQYIYKMYDKGTQESLNKEILRIEYKILKMASVKATGIKTLSDLLNKNTFNTLKKYLITPIEEIIFFEQIDYNKLNKKNKELYLQSRSGEYWHQLSIDNRDLFKYNRKKYYNILELYGSCLKKNLVNKIDDKFKSLLFPKLTYSIIPQINQHFITNRSPYFNCIPS